MEKVLVLKSVNSDMTSGHDKNFKYPESGHVFAPDFQDNKKCGHGLHGWLWGIGDFSLKVASIEAKWLVIEVDKDSIIELDEKVKFKEGNVIFCGNFVNAFNLVWSKYKSVMVVEDVNSTTGYSAHASTTGKYAHASTTGDSAHASTTGYSAHASTTGKYAHASTTGDSAHASTEKNGTACTLGLNTKVKCGEDGAIILTYWDGKRFRHVIGYEGETIKKDTWYTLNDNHEIIEA